VEGAEYWLCSRRERKSAAREFTKDPKGRSPEIRAKDEN